jgi:hypothetical protein
MLRNMLGCDEAIDAEQIAGSAGADRKRPAHATPSARMPETLQAAETRNGLEIVTVPPW